MLSYVNKVNKVKEHGIVTLEEAKKQLNVDTDFHDDDTHIRMLIESARGAAEDYTGVDIALTLNTLTFVGLNTDQIKIKEGNYISVESVTATVDDVETVIDSEDYEIEIRRTDFTIHFINSINVDELVIEFKTGFSLSTLPYLTKSAILIKITDLYDIERSSYITGANFKDTKAFERLLNGQTVNRW